MRFPSLVVGALAASAVSFAGCSLEVMAIFGEDAAIGDGGDVDAPGSDGGRDGGIPDSGPPPRTAPRSMTATLNRTCVIDSEGALYCFGRNPLGSGEMMNSATPVRVRADLEWAQVSTNVDHSCAVTTSGELWCWGLGDFGRLGVGDTSTHYEPARVGSDSSWAQVATGGYHTCARKTDGSLHCFGSNSVGQLGLGMVGGSQNAPSEVNGGRAYLDVACGQDFSCAIRDDRALECWGTNANGQLGNNMVGTDASAPTQVGLGLDWIDVEAGPTEACGLRPSNLFCWGRNQGDFLGAGAGMLVTPTVVADMIDVERFSIGRQSACATARTSGEVLCWGENLAGQLGVGDMTSRRNPTAVATNPAHLVAVGYQHACAGARSGELYCWGGNSLGELGLGTPGANVLTPATVTLP